MVNGPSPGPQPAAQPGFQHSRLTRSNWRTWPHRKLRRKVPRVDGALTSAADGATCPAGTQHVGVVNEVAPSQRRATRPPYSQQLVSRVRPPRRVPQVDVAVRRLHAGPGAGLGSPGAAAQHWPRGGGRQTRFGCGRDGCVLASIGCSLFWGRLTCCFKTIIPDSQELASCRFRTLTRRPPSVDSG